MNGRSSARECRVCRRVYFAAYDDCPECWTRCQTCDRGMLRIDASNISAEGFEEAGSIIMYAEGVKPGRTEVISSDARACARCKHRVSMRETCCSTCKYVYFMESMDAVFPRAHSKAILEYIGGENLM